MKSIPKTIQYKFNKTKIKRNILYKSVQILDLSHLLLKMLNSQEDQLDFTPQKIRKSKQESTFIDKA